MAIFWRRYTVILPKFGSAAKFGGLSGWLVGWFGVQPAIIGIDMAGSSVL